MNLVTHADASQVLGGDIWDTVLHFRDAASVSLDKYAYINAALREDISAFLYVIDMTDRSSFERVSKMVSFTSRTHVCRVM